MLLLLINSKIAKLLQNHIACYNFYILSFSNKLIIIPPIYRLNIPINAYVNYKHLTFFTILILNYSILFFKFLSQKSRNYVSIIFEKENNLIPVRLKQACKYFKRMVSTNFKLLYNTSWEFIERPLTNNSNLIEDRSQLGIEKSH